MHRRVSGVFLISFLMGSPALLSAQTRSYEEMRAEVVELYGAERFSDAAEILKEALELYPDHLMANCVNLALMHVRSNDIPSSLAALRYGLDHGIWFGKYSFLDPVWDAMKEHPDWASFGALNQEAKEKEALEVKPRLEVVLPDGFDPVERYPLFLALHGGGENIDLFMPHWISPRLQRDFIVAFPQSTQLIAMNGFNWTEDIQFAMGEVGEAFRQVVRDYPVDLERVIVGGFSSGGVASLEVVLGGVVPVQGFVVLCPAMPEEFTPERVRDASARGIRGTVLTTEMDGRLDQQRRMAEIMESEGLVHEFYVTPNVGHWYPDDLAQRIDQAIAHILEGRPPL